VTDRQTGERARGPLAPAAPAWLSGSLQFPRTRPSRPTRGQSPSGPPQASYKPLVGGPQCAHGVFQFLKTSRKLMTGYYVRVAGLRPRIDGLPPCSGDSYRGALGGDHGPVESRCRGPAAAFGVELTGVIYQHAQINELLVR
jgi:hypothetical protein